jgi:thiamine biosynthesis lipoprotein
LENNKKSNYLSDYPGNRISPFVTTCYLLVIFICYLITGSNAQAQAVIKHYDGVLGTSLDVTVYGVNSEIIETAIESMLSEIASLEQILTTYNEGSELMRLNTSRATNSASTTLIDVVSACENWFTLTQGVFSCRIAEIIDFWDVAERNQSLPSRRDVSPIARKAINASLIIEPQQNAIQLGDGIKLDSSGLAKGYIIDQALEFLRRELTDVSAIKLDIGGDAYYWGTPPNSSGWQVEVANPDSIADNGDYISSLSLNSKAIATSGHTSRKRQILMREFSHIFNPLTGWPITNGIYSVVIASDAITADAVATTLSALPLDLGIELIESLPGIEAMLINTNGAREVSSGWNQYLIEEFEPTTNANFSFILDYSIPYPTDLRNYEKPYVAIWVSTTDNRAIKNLILLGENERWAGSNTRWWRYAGSRNGLIEKDNVTRPTRSPGEYQLVWDGRDDEGNLLPPGDYLLNVEFSREHGGHRYRTVQFSFTEGTQIIEQSRYGEIGAFKLTLEISFVE